MSAVATAGTRAIPQSCEKSVVLIRRLLSAEGLTVVGEFDISSPSRSCKVRLVDTPLALFEAIALDRSAAVLVPLHVVVSGDGDGTSVHWGNPVATGGMRPPAPAKAALERLYARVSEALSELAQAAETGIKR